MLKGFFAVREKDLFSRCNVPWTLGIVERSGDNVLEACNLSDATHQSLKLLEFYYASTAYSIPGCKGKIYRYITQYNQSGSADPIELIYFLNFVDFGSKI